MHREEDLSTWNVLSSLNRAIAEGRNSKVVHLITKGFFAARKVLVIVLIAVGSCQAEFVTEIALVLK